jgi:hypothetical protein
MNLRYVLFRDDPSTHDEVYLARAEGNKSGFKHVKRPDQTSITFETAAEGYAFAKHFPQLEYWRVGMR